MPSPSERPDLVKAMIAILNREFSYVPELLPILIEKFKDKLVHCSGGPFRVETDWTIPQEDEEWPYPMILPTRIARMKAILLYEFLKPGDPIIVDVPGWEWNGQELVLEKKQNMTFRCIDPKNRKQVWKLNPSSVKLVAPREKKVVDFKVGDLVTIPNEWYRPRYEEDSIFVVVWKGIKYVRLVPRFPKYETLKSTSVASKRPGDNIFERTDPGSPKHWRMSIYNTDVPFHELAPPPSSWEKEDLEMTKDLYDLGL